MLEQDILYNTTDVRMKVTELSYHRIFVIYIPDESVLAYQVHKDKMDDLDVPFFWSSPG